MVVLPARRSQRSPFIFIPCGRKTALRLVEEGGVVTRVETAQELGQKRDRPLPATNDLDLALAAGRPRVLIASIGRQPVATEWVLRPDDLLNIHPYRTPRSVLAAGGLVCRTGPGGFEVLVIHRRGVWDLPKGKLDPGETIGKCALREVREEVGITDLTSIGQAGTTYHTYPESKHLAVKTTTWYMMQTPEVTFIPQAAESIDAVEWMAMDRATRDLGFDTLRDLVRSTHEALLDGTWTV